MITRHHTPETQEALRQEREKIAELVCSWGYPFGENFAEQFNQPLASAILKRTCQEVGHSRPLLPSNQLNGRAYCRYCYQEIGGAIGLLPIEQEST